MDVAVIFDVAFEGVAGQVVWIIDTPANRNWFRRQADLDESSALFSIERYRALDEAVVHSVWNAQEHSPAWTAIDVIGAALSDRVAADLAEEGDLSMTASGFRLVRP